MLAIKKNGGLKLENKKYLVVGGLRPLKRALKGSKESQTFMMQRNIILW